MINSVFMFFFSILGADWLFFTREKHWKVVPIAWCYAPWAPGKCSIKGFFWKSIKNPCSNVLEDINPYISPQFGF